ncbi:hypothetical protein [Pseudovibrio exalbescens]|uniref:hypothetical protein n=1 Tax=Pseudovibrio exalbescens TaxID=197461 RepID=UPI000C99F92B|nr:hypothetical protein [Pseudovibrio exalbescens]
MSRDGITIKQRELDDNIKKLRRIVPALDDEMDKALKRTTDEHVRLSRELAPRESGELAASLRNEKVKGGVATFRNARRRGRKTVVETRSISATSSWGLYAMARWVFAEFGTVHAEAHPFIFPVARLLKRRHTGRMRRALSKAHKRAFRK